MFFQPPTPNSQTRAAQRPTSTVSWSSKILLRIHGKFMIHHHARLMVANPDPLHSNCFAPQDARPGIESRLMEPGGGEVSLDLYMLRGEVAPATEAPLKGKECEAGDSDPSLPLRMTAMAVGRTGTAVRMSNG